MRQPLAFSVSVLVLPLLQVIAVPPSLNTTVPVGVPAVEVTVAVNVTVCANCDGLTDEVTTVVVDALVTVRFAVLLVVPVPPFVDVTAPVVLLFTPAVVPVTVTEGVQIPPAVNVPLLKLMNPVE